MSSLDDAASNGSSSRRTKQSISKKITSFLSRSSAHISGFHIELDDPLRQHGPGDTVNGTVVLNVAKPLGVTHVVACLYGYVQVFKNHSKQLSKTPRHNISRAVSGQNKRWVSEYYGDGFASLFEEEVVLCGEGRLDPKLYHFRFAIDFPTDLPLPSSIDFERGTIHYMVCSTVTRPNPIVSTTTCERKVYFRDHLDVGSLPMPKPQKVTLRAMVPSVKARAGLHRLTSYEKKTGSRASTLSRANQSTRTLESKDGMSVSQRASESNQSSRSSSSSTNQVVSLMSEMRSSQPSVSPKRIDLDGDSSNRSITVWIEPSRTGCLPGDTVLVYVRIQHIKVIQSLRGVIVTCHRQARVDMHPNLPVVSSNRGRDGQYEDYYPRSKTGLGGLSLTAAGSSQAWRKDLSQASAPLYIDPSTRTAEIKVSVRVPDDAFPSISNVPGEMISFKYFLEIIIDIHGKLGTVDRNFPNAGNGHSSLTDTPRAQSGEAADYSGVTRENECLDTSGFRREKNAIVLQCDLLVGTKDSEKIRGKQKAAQVYAQSDVSDATRQIQALYSPLPPPASNGSGWDGYGGNYETVGQNGYYNYGYDHANYPHDDRGYYEQDYNNYDNYLNSRQEEGYGDGPDGPHGYRSYYPPPVLEDESNLSEKERLRRAEERLLPSQPPEPEAAAGAREGYAPIVPVLHEVSNMFPAQYHGPGVLHATLSQTQAQRHGTAVNGEHEVADDHATTSRGQNGTAHNNVVKRFDVSDDKQELERRRLQGQASAPDNEAGMAYEAQPSAPSAAIADELEFGGPAFNGSGNYHNTRDLERLSPARDPLPRYER